MAKAKSQNPSEGIFDDSGQLRSARSVEAARSKLNSDVEAFLASGGKIDVVERNVRSDPIQKPKTNYGSRPI